MTEPKLYHLKKTKNCVFFFIILLSILTSCQNGKGNKLALEAGDTIPIKYAQYLTMMKHDGFTEVTLQNPWKADKMLHRYILIPKGDEGDKVASQFKRNAHTDVVRTPVDNSIIFTAPHCELMYELGCPEVIKGVCDFDYINIPDLHEREIVDCGSSMQPMMEKIMDCKPEAMLISPFENTGYGKLEKLNIPIIETADYMETSPLGRAEWIKFYGAIFGREHQADSLFASIDSTYQALKAKARKLPKGHSILTERKTGSVWYTPGGKSTIGILIADANAAYAFANDKHNGSLALSPEQILDKAKDMEIWAFKYIGRVPLTRADLLQEYQGYASLEAFKTGDIYECNTGVVPYFEQTSFHPEYLLREFMQLTHPEMDLGGLRYYKKMTSDEYFTVGNK